MCDLERPPRGSSRATARVSPSLSKSACTRARAAPGRTSSSPPFWPMSRPIAWASRVLPAPISPVMTLRPGENSRRAAAMRTRSSIASSASIAAVEELLLDVLVEGPFGAHHEARQLGARGDAHVVAEAQAPHLSLIHISEPTRPY